MKKIDYYLIFIMFVIILIASKFPQTKENVEDFGFTKNVLFLEENDQSSLPINFVDDREEIIFYYSNDGIIQVEGMKINALNVGSTTLTAKINNQESKIDIHVINKPILVSPKNTISINEKIEITFSNEEKVGATRDDFDWTVSDENNAKIDKEYMVKGLKDGKVIITATLKADSSISSTYELTVSTPKVDYATKLINNALAEEGYVEESSGYTKYGDWYGLTYEEWCAMFVSWVSNKTGISTNIIPKFASVKVGKAFFESKGLFNYKGSYTPKKGDIIFFLNNASHAAIVTEVKDGRVYTIEGNTARKVAQRNYSLNDSTITGYGTPNYNLIKK